MMEFLSIKFWVGLQMGIDLLIILFILYYLRNIRAGIREEVFRQVLETVTENIAPFLNDAEKTAATFDRQIREKQTLIKAINEKLDARIISLNLLLKRSEGHISPGAISSKEKPHVYDQQQAILDLYETGLDNESISKKLSMPKGEVDLVINLKKKFVSLD